jgi:aminoglycoside phosphotransferase (APT) family kinase protein
MSTGSPVSTPTAALDPETQRQRLAHWLAARLPDVSELQVSPLQRPNSGISNETYFLDLHYVQAGKTMQRSLVVRWPPQGFTAFPRAAYDMGRQYHLLRGLTGSTVPVPPVLGLEEDARILGAPFYVMEKVQGWVPSDFPPYHVAGPLFEAPVSERQGLWWSAVETLAHIHTLDWRKAGLGFLSDPGDGREFMPKQIALYDAVHALNGEPLAPVLARTREWLQTHTYTPRHISLCWGDARLGNLVIRDQQVASVLDWEMACLGDAESDLGWFAHIDWATSEGRSRGATPRLEGLPDMTQTLARYETLTGRRVERFHYHQVFATWRLAILFTRIEQDPHYLARSGNAKGAITASHFAKLERLLNEDPT